MITAVLDTILYLALILVLRAGFSLVLIALIYGWQAAHDLVLCTYDRALRWLIFRLIWRMTRRGREHFVIDFTKAIVAELQEGP